MSSCYANMSLQELNDWIAYYNYEIAIIEAQKALIESKPI